MGLGLTSRRAFGPEKRRQRERVIRSRRFPVVPAAVGAVLVVGLLALAPKSVAQRGGGRIAVATENKSASQLAIAQMQKGGTAVDAMVTAALSGGVASPTSSGVGGGGFGLVWIAAERRAYLLDFRETAPKGIDVAAFENRPFSKDQLGRLSGVPGEVRGLYQLHKLLGKRKWNEVVEPAARLAKTGFPVVRHLGNMLKGYGKRLKQDPGVAGVYYPNGRPAAVGNLVKNPALARTLEKIAASGPAAFYEGDVASDIVESARKNGGALTLADLKDYRPAERKPLHVRWEGYDVYTMPPPSAGGLMLVQTLKLYKKAELAQHGIDSGAYQHLVAEALRAAIADRMRYLGDPDKEKVDVAKLVSDERMALRKKRIALDRTHGIPRFGLEGAGTHHLVTADALGNVVTLTTTVNRLFGAKYTTEKSGIVMNDELDDFTTKSSVAPFGMKESPNRPRPGARPVSSMTPTIVVKNGRVVLALGGSGGTAIATNTTQMVLSNLVFGNSPKQALAKRRFYIPTRQAYIMLEQGAPKSLVRDLESRGEIVGFFPFKTTAMQMVAIDERGHKLAASDPRKHGSAIMR